MVLVKMEIMALSVPFWLIFSLLAGAIQKPVIRHSAA